MFEDLRQRFLTFTALLPTHVLLARSKVRLVLRFVTFAALLPTLLLMVRSNWLLNWLLEPFFWLAYLYSTIVVLPFFGFGKDTIFSPEQYGWYFNIGYWLLLGGLTTLISRRWSFSWAFVTFLAGVVGGAFLVYWVLTALGYEFLLDLI